MGTSPAKQLKCFILAFDGIYILCTLLKVTVIYTSADCLNRGQGMSLNEKILKFPKPAWYLAVLAAFKMTKVLSTCDVVFALDIQRICGKMKSHSFQLLLQLVCTNVHLVYSTIILRETFRESFCSCFWLWCFWRHQIDVTLPLNRISMSVTFRTKDNCQIWYWCVYIFHEFSTDCL